MEAEPPHTTVLHRAVKHEKLEEVEDLLSEFDDPLNINAQANLCDFILESQTCLCSTIQLWLYAERVMSAGTFHSEYCVTSRCFH